LGKLMELSFGKTHLASSCVFTGQICVEHCGIIGGEHDGNPVTKKLRERMVGKLNSVSLQLTRERTRFEIAHGTDFQGNAAIGE